MINSVVVVDDYQPAAEAMCRLLKLLGHEARSCADPDKCLELIEQAKPDAILLDIVMPGISGLELVGLIRQRLEKSCKIIAVTGHVDREMKTRCLAAGFDDFMVKPATIGELEAVLGLNPSSSPRPAS
jgi:CheY-like chemotaxis protein